MSEIAEELERLATRIETEARGIDRSARGDSDLAKRRRGEVCGMLASVRVLRDRAEELRAAAKSAPLPKPERVESLQWWGDGDRIPARIYSITSDLEDDEARAYFQRNSAFAFSEGVRVLLSNPRWLYLGDGPEPAR